MNLALCDDRPICFRTFISKRLSHLLLKSVWAGASSIHLSDVHKRSTLHRLLCHITIRQCTYHILAAWTSVLFLQNCFPSLPYRVHYTLASIALLQVLSSIVGNDFNILANEMLLSLTPGCNYMDETRTCIRWDWRECHRYSVSWCRNRCMLIVPTHLYRSRSLDQLIDLEDIKLCDCTY